MITKESALQSNTISKKHYISHDNWWVWFIPQPFSLVSSLLFIGVLIPYLYDFFQQTGYVPTLVWWQAALMSCATLAALALERIEYFLYGEDTPLKAAVVFFVARVALIEILCWLDRFQYSPFLYLLLPFLGCLYFGELAGFIISALVWIAYIVKHSYYNPSWINDGTELHYLVLFTVGIILVITITRVLTREKASRERAEELLAELEVSHQQLKEYAEQVEELATTRERNRLARDIHDTLGHYLTTINVQLEKALTFYEQKPREAVQAVSDAKRLAREALQDVRGSVRSLRTTREESDFTPALGELIEHVQNENCIVEVRREGDEKGFSKQRLLVLYRVIQEGLTNVQRHANASRIEIDLLFGELEIALELRDNGDGFDTTGWQKAVVGHEGGYGLTGLQERLELAGGSLQVESAPHEGTRLRAIIPRNAALPGERIKVGS